MTATPLSGSMKILITETKKAKDSEGREACSPGIGKEKTSHLDQTKSP